MRFYCDIRYPDGTPFEGDGRHLLREANRRARRAGYSLTMGTARRSFTCSSWMKTAIQPPFRTITASISM